MSHFSLTALVAIFTAVGFALVGIRQRENRTQEKIGILLANGAACGPLLMILVSPFAQVMHSPVDLYGEVVQHETAILWWAVAIAVLNLIWTLL